LGGSPDSRIEGARWLEDANRMSKSSTIGKGGILNLVKQRKRWGSWVKFSLTRRRGLGREGDGRFGKGIFLEELEKYRQQQQMK